jgi:hypothetical protein
MGPEAALNTHGHLNVPFSGQALNRWDFRQSNGRSKAPSRRGVQECPSVLLEPLANRLAPRSTFA